MQVASKKTPGRMTRQQAIYQQFVGLVQRHYARERSLAFYADKICITPRYLSRIVHEVSGRFASEFIDDYVIAEAKLLIESQRYTVTQICDMLNFNSPSFFARYFKKFTGYTPTQYQKK